LKLIYKRYPCNEKKKRRIQKEYERERESGDEEAYW